MARIDGSTADFEVDPVESLPKDAFPLRAVYGDTGYAALRLITCGGSFDEGAGSYRNTLSRCSVNRRPATSPDPISVPQHPDAPGGPATRRRLPRLVPRRSTID